MAGVCLFQVKTSCNSSYTVDYVSVLHCQARFALFYLFLHMFMSKILKSEAQLTGCSLPQCSAFALGAVPPYRWNKNKCHLSICSTQEDQNPNFLDGFSCRQINTIFAIGRAHVELFLSKCSFCAAYQGQESFSNHSAHFSGFPSSGGNTKPYIILQATMSGAYQRKHLLQSYVPFCDKG